MVVVEIEEFEGKTSRKSIIVTIEKMDVGTGKNAYTYILVKYESGLTRISKTLMLDRLRNPIREIKTKNEKIRLPAHKLLPISPGEILFVREKKGEKKISWSPHSPFRSIIIHTIYGLAQYYEAFSGNDNLIFNILYNGEKKKGRGDGVMGLKEMLGMLLKQLSKITNSERQKVF